MKMLVYRTRFWVSLFIFLMICQVSASHKPIFFPNLNTILRIENTGEIVIEEGKVLEIVCINHTPIKLHYPLSFRELINTSFPIIFTYEGSYYRHILKRKTVFADTGWYACADHNIEIDINSYNSEVNWLYVYVKSNTNLFVETDINAHLSAIAGDSIVIPCRPTSPDIKSIFLINSNKDELKKALFNPTIGFTIRNLQINDSNPYKCLIKKDNEEHAVNYVLSVHLNRTLPEPYIDANDFWITLGEDLYVNCTIKMKIRIRYKFDWNTPQQNTSRRSIQQFKKQLDGDTVLITSQLTIFNVTIEDSGNYECIVKSIYDKKRIMLKIDIDPQTKLIELFPKSNIKYYRKESGSEVELIIEIRGFPNLKMHLQWFKPNGEKIEPNPKYFITTKLIYNYTISGNTSLKIISLNVKDSGNYMLQAKNEITMEKINFTLDVIAIPISTLTHIDSYYPVNKNTEFHCEVISNPPPNITWSFQKYPNYPSLENSTIVNLTNVVQDAAYNFNYSFKSIVKMLIEVSGKIICKACNILACDSMIEDVLVSDGIGAFGIIGPKESVLKGDNITLICAASVYNYMDKLRWTILENQTVKPLVETDRLKIVQYETPFTYRSMLKFINVQESDAQDYFCTGKIMNTSNHGNLDPLSDYESYKLHIYNPVPPFFVKTNMNETKIRVVDVITEGHKTMKLQCFVEGMPKPLVSWYKNNISLDENSQYHFVHNYQELHIRYFKQHDNGQYSCKAISRMGTNQTYQQIIVKNAKWHTLDIILVTSILGFVVIILAISFTIKIYHEKKMRKQLIEAGLLHFEKGALERLNPNLTIDDQAELLPYDKKWEFKRERLKLREPLGSGNFGVVMKAEAIGICKNESITTVAVKMVRRTTNPIYIRALVSELKIMVHLGKHLNVVNLLGACTKNISKCELLVIVEYCRNGNLYNYLLRHKNDFINQIDSKTGKFDFSIGMDMLSKTVNVSDNRANSDTNVIVHCPGTNPDSSKITLLPDIYPAIPDNTFSSNSYQPERRLNYCDDYKDQHFKPISTQDLLSWAFQVARGMDYLSQRKVLHGDLAARNILLAEDNVVKICDFGLAKNMYKNDNYKRKGDAPVPIKWMAIESIKDRIFSTQSDIWSFGIMLWEFFTLAKMPYHDIEEEKVYQKLIDGYRMEQPNYAIREVYDIMLQCWEVEPTLRPSFTNLVENIGNFLEESVRMHYINLNTLYMDMNTINLENAKSDYLTMLSAPNHTTLSLLSNNSLNIPSLKDASDSSLDMHFDCPMDKSETFTPKPCQDHSNIEFLSPASDPETSTKLSPMLQYEENLYLKPINVYERRVEFARRRQMMKNQFIDRPIDQNFIYYNTLRNSLDKRYEQE